MLRKAIIALTAGAIVLTASACNTVRGAGRDVESAANAGSDAIH
jgi:entericidin B